MLSRTLSLATVTLLISCLSAIPVRAQNLDAGKSPSQIFSGTCTACHKAPRGLLKSVSPGSLPGFMRQHYTTSAEMASQLSAFLIANGAADTRVGSRPTQQPKDARPVRPAPAQEAAKPEPQQAAKQDAVAPGPDGRKSAAKQKLSKRGKTGSEEQPEVDAARDESAKSEAAKEDTPKSEVAKENREAKETEVKETEVKETEAKETEAKETKEAAAQPSGEGEGKSEAANNDAPKDGDTPPLRADPVPPVTPAPPARSAAVSGGLSEPSAPPAPPPAPAPAVAASAPPLPPVPPAGPPAPPISQ